MATGLVRELLLAQSEIDVDWRDLYTARSLSFPYSFRLLGLRHCCRMLGGCRYVGSPHFL